MWCISCVGFLTLTCLDQHAIHLQCFTRVWWPIAFYISVLITCSHVFIVLCLSKHRDSSPLVISRYRFVWSHVLAIWRMHLSRYCNGWLITCNYDVVHESSHINHSPALYNDWPSLFGRARPPENLQGTLHSQIRYGVLCNQWQCTFLFSRFWLKAVSIVVKLKITVC